MPHIDGLQALELIQTKYQIPTVLISSMNKEDGSLVMKAMSMGAVDHILHLDDIAQKAIQILTNSPYKTKKKSA